MDRTSILGSHLCYLTFGQEQEGTWKWTRPQPKSRKQPGECDANGKRKGKSQKRGSVKEKLLKGSILVSILLMHLLAFS